MLPFPLSTMLVIYECNLQSHNMTHPLITAQKNTVLCLLFYKSYAKMVSDTEWHWLYIQHLNADFQKSCIQYVLPCEFLDCWVQNSTPYNVPSGANAPLSLLIPWMKGRQHHCVCVCLTGISLCCPIIVLLWLHLCSKKVSQQTHRGNFVKS